MARFRPSFGDFYYGYFQADGNDVGFQTALMTEPLEVGSYDKICVGFDFSMFGADMGQLYLVYEYSSFDSLTVIDPTVLENNADRQVILVNDGSVGTDWFTKFYSLDVSGKSNVQVKWQIRIGGRLSDVALDNITIVNGDGNCAASAVDGVWSAWGSWTSCTATCGSGSSSRSRTCNDPAPSGGGANCVGGNLETISCEDQVCPVDGMWTPWGSWTSCTATCGSGSSSRSRTCNDPAPSGGGANCVGGNLETISCEDQVCPGGEVVDGAWGSWVQASCTVTCGGGQQTSTRDCNDPEPQNGGLECALDGGGRALTEQKSSLCNTNGCPVDGMWTPWGSWTSCTATCGSGSSSRSRTCNDPAPSGGGANCVGENVETISCEDQVCPVTHGNWGEWQYDACSASCGGGSRTKTRECDDPVPSTDGNLCALTGGSGMGEKESFTEVCSDGACPINGVWSNWVLGECTTSCGDGVQERLRTCDDPAPVGGGSFCLLTGGSEVGLQESGTVACSLNPCLVHGMWSEWVEDDCTASCGGGFQDRSRSCNDPSPSGGGDSCLKTDGMSGLFEAIEVTCNSQACPVNGVWTGWQESECSALCGGGFFEKTRECSDPSPSNGGALCTLEDSSQGSEESISGVCNEEPCIVDGNWGEWNAWTDCTVTCNVGQVSRDRVCDDPSPANGGAFCVGENMETNSCFLGACPVAEIWSEWTNWSECTGTCGEGVRSRERTCENFPDACSSEKEFETEICSVGCRLPTCPTTAPGPCDCNFEDECENWISDSTSNTWKIGSHTPSTSTGPSVDHTFGSAGCGTFAYFEASGIPSGTVGEFASPFKTITVTQQCLSFYLSMYSLPLYASNMGTLTVSVWRGNGLVELKKFDGTTTTDPSIWTEVNLELDLNIDETVFILFSAKKGSSFLSDIALDDIKLSDGSCSGPVDGRWTNWNEWGSCDTTCGTGAQMRARTCSDPAPSNGGESCLGANSESRACSDLPECVVAGGWNSWTAWASCSTTCGDGTRRRFRECIDPATGDHGNVTPCLLGDSTTGFEEEETGVCSNPICTINGEWSNWTVYGTCTQTCGDAFKSRSRTCTDPEPSGSGSMCLKMDSSRGVTETMTLACAVVECPIDGVFTDWTSWSGCSATCGTSEVRSRTCTDPAPAFDGSNCVGSTSETRACGDSICPVDGVWSNWAAYDTCTVTCGGGRLPERRICDDPSPEGSGSMCDGGDGLLEERTTTVCGTIECPVDGVWSNWGPFGACTETCGSGTKTRTRSCDDPSPVGTGASCPGSDTNVDSCFNGHCPDPFDCTFETISAGDSSYTPTPCSFSIIDEPLNRWRISKGRTLTANTGPYSDHTLQTDQGYYVSFETSSRLGLERFPNSVNSFTLTQPSFSGSRCMSFWLHMFQNISSPQSAGLFRVTQQISSGAPQELLSRDTIQSVNTWVEHRVDLQNPSGNTYQIKFEGTRESSFADYGVDDVKFYSLPCADI